MAAKFDCLPDFLTRDDWLEWRRLGVGGSDVAAICGLSTFGSPTSVYYDKVGLAPEEAENEAMRWGRLLEEPIAAEFTERTGLHVAAPQGIVWDDEHIHRRVTLDGLIFEHVDRDERVELVEALGTIQIKTTGDNSWDNEIPDRIQLQCQWELGVCGLAHCWLVVLHMGFGRHLAIYEVAADPAVFDRLTAIVDRFWNDHVLAQNPPPADSNPATTAALQSVYGPSATGETIEFDDEMVAVAVEWLAAKHAVDHATEWKTRVENTLRAELGDATFGAYPQGDTLEPLVSWKPQSTGRRLDVDALRATHPDIADEFTKPAGITRVLRATKTLKALAGAPIEEVTK